MKINNENNDDSQLAIAAAVGETNRLLVSLSTPFNSLSPNYIYVPFTNHPRFICIIIASNKY